MDQKVEIVELRESGDDGGDLMGYFCRGHIDRHVFARAANEFSGAFDHFDTRHVRAERARHVWWRTVQMEGEPKGTMEFRPSLPGAGAWAATVCESVVDHSHRATRRVIQEFERGRCNGIAEGVNWALRFLEYRNRRLHDLMLKTFRDKRDEIEKETAA
jgi:hypothetical protein